jgi:uncharacterized protein
MVQGTLLVRNVTRDKVLATKAAEARGFSERFIGLMGQTELPVGCGLHIVPCNSIHTFFMRIPIDALFLDPQGKVIKVMGALPPWRMTSVYFDVRSVLELPAGVAAASGTVEGDQLEFTHGVGPRS